VGWFGGEGGQGEARRGGTGTLGDQPTSGYRACGLALAGLCLFLPSSVFKEIS
jgi:hypothetical protein